MDALLHAQPFVPTAGRRAATRPRPGPGRSRSRRPGVVTVPAGRPRPAVAWSVPAIVVATTVVLGVAIVAVRLAQGAPPTTSWAELAQASVADAAPVAGPGDLVVTVAPGDTLWDIARRLAPGRDPRPLVSALTEANGGTLLQVGQDVVIPAHLLAG